jgi:hypothetical protein
MKGDFCEWLGSHGLFRATVEISARIINFAADIRIDDRPEYTATFGALHIFLTFVGAEAMQTGSSSNLRGQICDAGQSAEERVPNKDRRYVAYSHIRAFDHMSTRSYSYCCCFHYNY